MVRATVFQAWADLLRYPGDGRATNICARIDQIGAEAPAVRADLEPLFEFASEHEETDLEEVFTKTFDSNAERALEVGWHLHGENYARGAFMVRMRNLLRELEIEETCELPDHISHVLSVLARAEPDLTEALARSVVSPALAKIAEGFGDGGNPYLGVVTSLQKYIDLDLEAAAEETAQ